MLRRSVWKSKNVKLNPVCCQVTKKVVVIATSVSDVSLMASPGLPEWRDINNHCIIFVIFRPFTNLKSVSQAIGTKVALNPRNSVNFYQGDIKSH